MFRVTSRMAAALLLVLLPIQHATAFLVAPPRRTLNPSSSSQLLMAAVAPPPTTPPAPIEKNVAATATASLSSTSNLPSQKELGEKAQQAAAKTTTTTATTTSAAKSSEPAPAPKSTNLVSGTGLAISDIHYDGDVPTTESDEYVVVTNQAKTSLDVSGYYIYVATTGTQGPTFTFPKGSEIKSGQSIRIYTNEIHKESGGYSYGSKKAIWNNRGGLAVLKDVKGKKLMEYLYKPNTV